MNLFDLPDERTEEVTVFVPAARMALGIVVAGFWRHYVGPMPVNGIPPPLPTLNKNPHDLHGYTDAQFRLAAGVRLEIYPLSGCLGLRVRGEKELVSLYDGVRRELAVEVKG